MVGLTVTVIVGGFSAAFCSSSTNSVAISCWSRGGAGGRERGRREGEKGGGGEGEKGGGGEGRREGEKGGEGHRVYTMTYKCMYITGHLAFCNFTQCSNVSTVHKLLTCWHTLIREIPFLIPQ